MGHLMLRRTSGWCECMPSASFAEEGTYPGEVVAPDTIRVQLV